LLRSPNKLCRSSILTLCFYKGPSAFPVTLGKGLIAMFTGSSGTGKTMAAELLAREQGVDLYKVDLSAVVSKWVGETEKNLSRVFAGAADTNTMIFFYDRAV